MDDAGLVVEEDIRDEGAAVRDVEVAVLHPVAGEDGALVQHLLQVSPALVTQTQGSSDTQPQRGTAGRGGELSSKYFMMMIIINYPNLTLRPDR